MLKTGKKLLVVWVSLAMVLSMFTFAYADVETGAAHSAESYTGQTIPGDYTISTAAQLAKLAQTVNAGTAYEGSTFILTSNINLGENDSCGILSWTGGSEWTPIGTASVTASTASGNGFAGTIDGAGFTVSGMSITTAGSCKGFVGYLAPAGTVKNLILEGSIRIESTGSIDAVGGVAGYNSGTINKVINRASVYASKGYNVGGITGFNNGYYGISPVGTISQCGNEGVVSGYSKIGGIAGENSGTISECYNYGTITNLPGRKGGTGGIAGCNGNNNTAVETGVITSCFNRGYVDNNNGYWGGAIAGFQNSLSNISSCYVTADTYHCNWSNPIVGKNESGLNGTNYSKDSLYHSSSADDSSSVGTITMLGNMQTQSFAETLGECWTWSESVNAALPYFSWQTGKYIPIETNASDGISGSSAQPDLTGLQNSIVIDSRFTETGSDSAGNVRYNSLSELLSQVSSGTVFVTGPVVIPAETTATITNNLTFVRYNTYTDGYLFEVNGTLNLQAGTISGNSIQCNAQVIVNTGGTFNMSGGTIANADGIYRPGAGVYVCGGTYHMSGGTLSELSGTGTNTKASAVTVESGLFNLTGGTIAGTENDAAIFVNGRFVLDPTAATSITGVVRLNGVALSCGQSLSMLSGTVVIDNLDENINNLIATDVLSCSDAEKITYYNNECILGYDDEYHIVYISSVNMPCGSSEMNLQSADDIDWSNANTITEDITIDPNTVITQLQTISGGTAESPVTVTIDGKVTFNNASSGMFKIDANSYVKIAGINNAELCTNANTLINETKALELEISGVTLNANGGGTKTNLIMLQSGSNCNVTLNNGTKMIGTSSPQMGVVGISMRNGTLTIDDAEISCGQTSVNPYVSQYIPGVDGIRLTKGGLVIKKGSVVGDYNGGYPDIFASSSAAVSINPTGKITIGTVSVSSGTITLTPQNGCSITSYKLNGVDTEIPTKETSLETSFNSLALEVLESQPEPAETYNAYLKNVSDDEIAPDGTFTADVYVKSDSTIDGAEIDLSVENGTISNMEASEVGSSCEASNSKITFYGNTASAADGIKVATVTVAADQSGKDVVLRISDTSIIAKSSEPDFEGSFTLGEDAIATVTIFKSDKVSCTQYAGSKYLVQYTGEIADGNVAMYDGSAMIYSDKLGAWIAISDTDVSGTLYNNSVTAAAGTKESADYSGDVNMNSKVNIVDAQIAYDISVGTVYTDYSVATQPMWYRADANGDGVVSALDARAIQCVIHGITG